MDRPCDDASSFRLDGRVAVVIGGTGVLGRRIAGALAGAGARAVVVGRDEAKGKAVSAALAGLDGDGCFEPCDATSRDELANLVGRVLRSHGRVDVLVNGAGVNSGTPFLEITDEELERIVAIDQLAVVRACQEFGRLFVARAASDDTGASIVTIGSMAAMGPLSRVFAYAMTKAAVHNLTRNLAREWAPSASAATCWCPASSPPSRTGICSTRAVSKRSWATRRSAGWGSLTTWSGRCSSSPATPGALSPAPRWSSTAASAP